MNHIYLLKSKDDILDLEPAEVVVIAETVKRAREIASRIEPENSFDNVEISGTWLQKRYSSIKEIGQTYIKECLILRKPSIERY